MQFPDRPPAVPSERPTRNPRLQEKIDIHALLFRSAWELDDEEAQRPAMKLQMEKAKSPATGGS